MVTKQNTGKHPSNLLLLCSVNGINIIFFLFFRKLVKNYSCGRLCDYEDFESVSIIKKFGSTPLFNIPTTNSAATIDRQTGGQLPTSAVPITATAGFRGKPKLSKSFTNNLYEKTYRKPSFTPSPFSVAGGGSIGGLGYSVPVTKSQQSLGGVGLAVNGPPTENYYAATDLLQVCN